MRSTTGVSVGSSTGLVISWPASFASSICRRLVPVLARQVSLVELAGEAVDHLTRQVQLGLFDLAVGDGLLDLRL